MPWIVMGCRRWWSSGSCTHAAGGTDIAGADIAIKAKTVAIVHIVFVHPLIGSNMMRQTFFQGP